MRDVEDDTTEVDEEEDDEDVTDTEEFLFCVSCKVT